MKKFLVLLLLLAQPIEARPKYGLDANSVLPSIESFNEFNQRKGFRIGSATGIDYVHFARRWDEIETSEGVYNLTTLSWILAEHQGNVSVTITAVNYDGTKNLPTYLSGLAFDNAAVLTAGQNLVDAVFAVTGSRLEYFSIGQEVEGYFSTHSSEISPFATLISTFKTRVTSHWASAPTIVSFKAATASTVETTYAAIKVACTKLGFTYYFVNPDFSFRDTNPATLNATLDSDIFNLVTDSGGDPIIITEAGAPSVDSGSASEALQGQFVVHMLAVAETYEGLGLLSHINYNWQCDWATWLLDYVGLSGPIRTFVGSLGLNRTTGYPKPGAYAFSAYLGGYTINFVSIGLRNFR